MSMYDMALGDGLQHARGATLLALIGRPDVGRFRDAWLERTEDGQARLAVYTRNGGGNREEYTDVIEDLAAHPQYLGDSDDSFDPTYATFYFSMPDPLPEEWAWITTALLQPPVVTGQRWVDLFARMKGKP